MNSSNSFNICPRCGNSNALNAKYCSRCGGQLKVPEEPVVCHKCHTHNSPMANFCRNCGTMLKVGAETKICPRCGKEVVGTQSVCECGYSFVTYQQTAPTTERAVNVSSVSGTHTSKEQNKAKKVASKTKVYNTKGGRGWAIAAMVLILVFAYLIIAPFQIPNSEGEIVATLRPEFLANFDKGIIYVEGVAGAYGYNLIDALVSLIKFITSPDVGADGLASVTWVGASMMALYLTVIFTITAFVHLIVCIVRTVKPRRSKKMNLYFLIMAIISTIVVGLILLFSLIEAPAEGLGATIASWFALSATDKLGYVIWAIPLYFWFFFLYSLCAKAKPLKEQA